jgi:hypothetical protein
MPAMQREQQQLQLTQRSAHVNRRNDEGRRTETPTTLYLVRVWRRKSGDGALSLHGKLQHVVSGTSCFFDGLSSLPGVLEKMMGQEAGSLGSDLGDALGDAPDGELHVR